jgi:CDP-paratose 2-epimerase
MRCTVSGTPYTVLGYDGKQVRDTIHPADVVSAIEAFLAAPRPGAVYNLGGGRDASVSLREAIPRCERISGRRLDVTFSEHARLGDHRWWITDLSEFRRDHPGWRLTRGVDDVLGEIYESNVEHWSAPARST